MSRSWGIVVFAALCLWAGTPPALFPGAPFLVLPGLWAFGLLATGEGPWRLRTWAVGTLHTWAFSSSLTHTFLIGWLPMGPIGGLYWLLAAFVTRRLRTLRLPLPLALGLGTALGFWLRAHMPEIHYPHGQAAHAFYLWPALLEPVRWGGEILLNGLLGALAGALVVLSRSWRTGIPARGPALAAAAAALVPVLFFCAVPAPAHPSVADTVDVAAVEPGGDPDFQNDPVRQRELLLDLVQATESVAGPRAEAPPALVLWPESSHPGALYLDALAAGRPPWDSAGWVARLHPDARLLVGAMAYESPPPSLETMRMPVAVLLDPRGEYLGHHEKLVCVPGGEKVPLGDLLPFLRDWGTGLGIPHFVPGVILDPLVLADGTEIAGIMCFENTFPFPAREQVRRGARLLCVLTNESWYRGGSELDQMTAITVFRTLENSTPAIRCTVDGTTVAVGRDGRVVAALPPRPESGTPGPRILRVSLPLGPGREAPMAWLHAALPWALLAAAAAAFLHWLVQWARLPRSDRAT